MKAIVRLVELGKIKDIPNGKIVIIGKKMFIVNDFFKSCSALQDTVYELVLELDPFDPDENIKIKQSNWQDILDKDLIDKDVDYEVFVILNSKTDKVVKKIGSIILPKEVEEEKLYTQKQFDAEYHRGFDNGFSEAVKGKY